MIRRLSILFGLTAMVLLVAIAPAVAQSDVSDVSDVEETQGPTELPTEDPTEDVDDNELPQTGSGIALAGLATVLAGTYGIYRFSGRGLAPGS